MEKNNLIERPLMSEEEFKDYMKEGGIDITGDFSKGILHLITYTAVNKVKSIRRAIKRGHVSLDGIVYPKRPFNNRKNRVLNERKKFIYGRIKQKEVV